MFVLQSELQPGQYLKAFDRSTPPQPILTDTIADAMHFPDVDTANINRDSIAGQTGHNFSVEEVTM
jgi:hypothetical protein